MPSYALPPKKKTHFNEKVCIIRVTTTSSTYEQNFMELHHPVQKKKNYCFSHSMFKNEHLSKRAFLSKNDIQQNNSVIFIPAFRFWGVAYAIWDALYIVVQVRVRVKSALFPVRVGHCIRFHVIYIIWSHNKIFRHYLTFI